MISRLIMRRVWLAPLLSFSISASGANAVNLATDRPGGTDHPLVSRYAGSTLYFYGEENYGTAPTLIMGKGKPIEEALEGKISNKIYWGPIGRSPLEIFRNYQAALRNAGFEVVYQCEPAQCGKDEVASKVVRWAQKAKWVDGGQSDFWIIRMFEYKPGLHYLHARRHGSPGSVDVQVVLRSGEKETDETYNRVPQFIQVVESVQVEQGKVTVDATAIANSLARDGKIALYGILFDTNLAVVKPESMSTLEQMASALKNNPALNVFIVGHTDNQGSVEANLALSRKRAQAVTELLRTRYGIAETRLLSQGVANFAPVASNLTEDGRAKNRRVEMVAR